MNPAIVQKIIQANESGKPRINGVADEKIVYPGQMIIREMRVMMMQKITLDFRRDKFLSGWFGVSATLFLG